MRDIRDQLLQLCERVEIFVEPNPNASDIVPIQKAISAGCALSSSSLLRPEMRPRKLTGVRASRSYFLNTGRLNRSGDAYRTLKCVLVLPSPPFCRARQADVLCPRAPPPRTNQTVHIHPSSSLFQHQPPPKLVLWFELVMTSREYARQVMEIKPEWLLEGASLSACCSRQPLTTLALVHTHISRAALLQTGRPRVDWQQEGPDQRKGAGRGTAPEGFVAMQVGSGVGGGRQRAPHRVATARCRRASLRAPSSRAFASVRTCASLDKSYSKAVSVGRQCAQKASLSGSSTRASSRRDSTPPPPPCLSLPPAVRSDTPAMAPRTDHVDALEARPSLAETAPFAGTPLALRLPDDVWLRAFAALDYYAIKRVQSLQEVPAARPGVSPSWASVAVSAAPPSQLLTLPCSVALAQDKSLDDKLFRSGPDGGKLKVGMTFGLHPHIQKIDPFDRSRWLLVCAEENKKRKDATIVTAWNYPAIAEFATSPACTRLKVRAAPLMFYDAAETKHTHVLLNDPEGVRVGQVFQALGEWFNKVAPKYVTEAADYESVTRKRRVLNEEIVDNCFWMGWNDLVVRAGGEGKRPVLNVYLEPNEDDE